MSDWLDELVAPPVAPGWFGKLLALGDFAHRRLPQPCVAALDRWLSEAILETRASMGASWDEAFRTAPFLRFILGPGVFDEHTWTGVMMPSVDAAGRYFPLLVLGRLAGVPGSHDGAQRLDAWHEAVESAMFATLSESLSPAAFDARLGNAPDIHALGGAATDGGPLAGAGGVETASSHSIDVLAELERAGARLLMVGASLWWRGHDGDSVVSPAPCWQVKGLPTNELFERWLQPDPPQSGDRGSGHG